MNASVNDLPKRCADYLKIGPPAHMENYIPDSLTEIIIAHGARSETLDPELHEIGGHILQEAGGLAGIEDDAIRRYMQLGISLVSEILHAKK